MEVRSRLPRLKAIVIYNGEYGPACNKNGKMVYSWSEFLQLGDSKYEATVQQRVDQQRPGHCCTLIYTSGTTGQPKAVMISHDNMVTSCKQVLSMNPQLRRDQQSIVSYLPLSHVAAQILDLHLPMLLSAYHGGCTTYFARPDALKGSLGETLKIVRPTIFFGVPRVWEKFAEKMRAAGAVNRGLKKRLVTWAKATGLLFYKACQVNGSSVGPTFFNVAKALVFDKVGLVCSSLGLCLPYPQFFFFGCSLIAHRNILLLLTTGPHCHWTGPLCPDSYLSRPNYP